MCSLVGSWTVSAILLSQPVVADQVLLFLLIDRDMCCVQVYFNEERAHVIRKLALATGIITIAAGVLGQDSGPGAIESPRSFAVSPTTGEMYI